MAIIIFGAMIATAIYIVTGYYTPAILAGIAIVEVSKRIEE